MKITPVRTRVLQWRGKVVPPQANFCTSASDALHVAGDAMGSFRFHEWLVCEVETDAGLVGIGNAALAPQLVKQAIDLYLAPLVVGGDPFDYEHLWQTMYRRTLAWGRKGVGMTAISAIDIALWDLMGKAVGRPVFKLLGGRTKERIPVYASKLYSQPMDDFLAEAQSYLDQGFTMMKMRFGYGPKDGRAGMMRNVEQVRALRDLVGDEVDIMVEAFMGWDLDYAKRMLPLLAPFQPRWLEEPVIADDIAGYAELNRLGLIPISGGEHEFTLFGFKQLLDAGAVSVIQYDTNRVGGITAAHKVNALAEAAQVPVVPHAGQMHNYHLTMSSLNCPLSEFFPVHDVEIGNELFYYVFRGDPAPENGFIDLDDERPGLGLEIAEDALDDFNVIE